MPDTGAPWNIPYVEAADLVSDWPADSLALANAIDAGLDTVAAAGIPVGSTTPTDMSLLAYDGATSEYNPTVVMAAGFVTIPASTTTVTLPSGRFTNAPIITLGCHRSDGFVSFNGTTTASQFVVLCRQFNGVIAGTGVSYIAIDGAA